MADVKSLAQYLLYSYEKITESRFSNDEMRLHKLMYFAQRESLALFGEQLFDSRIEGWVHGPVVTDLRFFFDYDFKPISDINDLALDEKSKYIIDNVIYQYAKYETWSLRCMTHAEKSWKNSREGLTPYQHGQEVLNIDDIIEDARNVRQYDHVFDMFIDEFDNLNGDTIHEVL
jgi:uncharacterized phage-associated protein